MMPADKPDLVGFYLTDDRIDMAYAFDPDMDRQNDPNIRLGAGGPKLRGTLSERFDPDEPPTDCIKRAVGQIRKVTDHVRAAYIGSYGPFESLTHGELGYGRLQVIEPKRPLRGIDLCDAFETAFVEHFGHSPETMRIETDVACAALGEAYRRYTRGGVWIEGGRSKVLAFLKVSVGIGGAISQSTTPYQGRLHSEMGQIIVRKWRDPWRDPLDDEGRFEGIGPYHGRLESLASVGAIQERFGAPFGELVSIPDHPAWHREAWYLGQACMALTALAAPSNIILGGRIMGVPGLLEKVRYEFRRFLGVDPYPRYGEMMDEGYISRDMVWKAGAPGRPGANGALVLAAARSRRWTSEVPRRNS